MYKKHFEEAARIIRDISNKNQRKATAIRFATLFRKFNSRFNQTRFFKACNL